MQEAYVLKQTTEFCYMKISLVNLNVDTKHAVEVLCPNTRLFVKVGLAVVGDETAPATQQYRMKLNRKRILINLWFISGLQNLGQKFSDNRCFQIAASVDFFRQQMTNVLRTWSNNIPRLHGVFVKRKMTKRPKVLDSFVRGIPDKFNSDFLILEIKYNI